MRRRVPAALVIGAAVLAACTPTQSATDAAAMATAAASSSASASAAASEASSREPRAVDAGTERQGVTASENSSESTGADDRAGGTSPGSAGDSRPRDDRLVAVGRDASGEKVERLQKRLAKLGFAPGPIDGAYGPRTEAAVTAFQRLVGLKDSGRANAPTVAALVDFETDVEILEAGDRGKAVKDLQRRLAEGPLDPGKADGTYGPKTVQAVWALEKLAGVPVDGNWGPLDEDAMRRLERGDLAEPANSHKKRWVEFDLSKQVMTVYDPGSSTPVLISHGSSGNGVPWKNEEHSGNSITPAGDFVISRRIDGWRESSLDIGRLYNPLYFNGGIAFHGATSVPLYPASHGCVRLPMHIAEYLPDELPNGTPVHVVQ